MNELAALFTITPGSPEPIYRQLVGQVRRRAASGQWPAGTEMPSVRELASALALNPMTISKALSLLEAEGVLVRRRGLTMVVAEGVAAEPQGDEATRLLRPALARAVAEARQLGLSQSRALDLFKQVWRDDASQE
jgi:GntR family transcriptional regulator